jgi:hypothetical protein
VDASDIPASGKPQIVSQFERQSLAVEGIASAKTCSILLSMHLISSANA